MEANSFGKGWILKAPFSQNSNIFTLRHFHQADELPNIIERVHKNPSTRLHAIKLSIAERIRYLILQPCVPVLNEEKVICFKGEPLFSSSHAKAGLKRKHKEVVLFDFAREAIKELQRNVKGAFLDDNISRVDIFSVDGTLYVNEFENLQAQYSKLGASLEEVLTSQLGDFYRDLLKNLLCDKDINVTDASADVFNKIGEV